MGLNIFLACYIKNNIEYNKKKNSIENVISNYFNSTSSLLAAEENTDGTVTLVFKIQRPLMQEQKHINDFFRKLETVFSVLSEYTPHFTQEFHYHSLSDTGV